MSKEDLDKMDEINLLWVFKQISVGNVIRGALYVGKIFKSVKECIVDAINYEDGDSSKETEIKKKSKKTDAKSTTESKAEK